jgi:protein tyrosine phosphatase (PTP) superfamily phosphohydrolase (DUF442 family)
MSTSDIYNYLQVNDHISTGGQPTEAQLQAAAAEGFAAVINLATYEPGHSLEDEAGLVQALGMAYYPIPVEWTHPKESDFAEFERTLDQLSQQKTLIHCAANFRVTAFYSLYAQRRLGWSATQADDFRAQIWQGSQYPVWKQFIARIRAQPVP